MSETPACKLSEAAAQSRTWRHELLAIVELCSARLALSLTSYWHVFARQPHVPLTRDARPDAGALTEFLLRLQVKIYIQKTAGVISDHRQPISVPVIGHPMYI